MDRRNQTRTQFPGPAKIKLLNSILGRGVVLDGTILDVSGAGMSIRIPRAVPCGIPVEVDAGDRMALGEICRCEMEGKPLQGHPPSSQTDPVYASHIIGVRISETVASLDELERFNRRLDEWAGKRDDSDSPSTENRGSQKKGHQAKVAS